MQQKSIIQNLEEELFKNQFISVDMLRLDQLHPVVSGNKIFKLKHYLLRAKEEKKTNIVTLGGYHSNHLVATSFACNQAGLTSIGIVRGEKPKSFSNTLLNCVEYGMDIKFYPRVQFDALKKEDLENEFPSSVIIPQGGYGNLGAAGASEILTNHNTKQYNYILASCGTGTMAAGLINSSSPEQHIHFFSALKNNFSIKNEIKNLLIQPAEKKNYELHFDYHFGGYAKKNTQVFEVMNSFYEKHKIPTDFVYTGKMIAAFYALLKINFFPENSRILLIHSGGLQGNRSLKNNELIF
jgi:1-aminocyclopropane-1-carboxylate deaminase/D-cysteine desulfhydrase-like pyridoxal-dependent ACC family enzyme